MLSQQELDFAKLKQELQDQKQRADNHEKRADEEKKRADAEKKRADDEKQRADDEKQRADNAEQKLRPTTLEEYLGACHTLVSKKLRIQTNKNLCTKGLITSPKNRPYPTVLKPWLSFPTLHQQLFERLHKSFSQDERLFSSINHLTEVGEKICIQPLASELDLERFQCSSIKDPITLIISRLQQREECRREFNLGQGVFFENHANTLGDSNKEVQQRLKNLQISGKQSSTTATKPKHADQICVHKQADGTLRTCMIIEYKPAHKLSISNLRAVLSRADSQQMNISEDVINRTTIPKDPEDNFIYKSELLVALALTQTYGYMIENGLEYSYLTTGEAYVFLRIMEDNPSTLYYHLAEPLIEAEADSEVDILLFRTTVGQTLTFCLMALDSEPRNQIWRNNALKTAPRYSNDDDAIIRQMPAEEKNPSPPPLVFHARVHPVERSAYPLRSKKPQKARKRCGSTDMTVCKNSQSPPGSSDENSEYKTLSKPTCHTRQLRTRQMSSVKSASSIEGSNVHHREFCTQACLLGLVRNLHLDDTCPNVNAHRGSRTGNKHALGQASLSKLIWRQLAKDPDKGCKPLQKQGARGALFKLTLESYGYTFVAKGTVLAFVADIKHEGLVYKHLDKVQGELIPVYLGNISLAQPYFLAVGVRIIHMLLMSWAGEQACEDLMFAMGRNLAAETGGAVAKMLSCGVEHRDVRSPNVLWNSEIRNVMLVDFERSGVLN